MRIALGGRRKGTLVASVVGALIMAAVTVGQHFLVPVSSKAQPWLTAVLFGIAVLSIIPAVFFGLRQSAPEKLTLSAQCMVHVRAGTAEKTPGAVKPFWTFRHGPKRTTRLPRAGVTSAELARDEDGGVKLTRKGDRPLRIGAGLNAAEAEWLVAVLGRWLRSC